MTLEAMKELFGIMHVQEEEVPNAKRMHVGEEEVSLSQPITAAIPPEEEEVLPEEEEDEVLPEEEEVPVP
jgi:hypothetical protein